MDYRDKQDMYIGYDGNDCSLSLSVLKDWEDARSIGSFPALRDTMMRALDAINGLWEASQTANNTTSLSPRSENDVVIRIEGLSLAELLNAAKVCFIEATATKGGDSC